MLKNKFFTILLMLILVSPAFGEPRLLDESEQLTPISSQETAGNTNTVQEKLPELDTIEYKQPVSKRKVAKKFLAAMAGVGISSILLFLILSLYNKIRENIIQAAKEIPPEGETSLVTPDSLTDAIKTFLEKTKWDN